MEEELIEVLDDFGNKTGIIKSKSQIKKDGDYHRAVSICIINSNNEILMHKRSSKKLIFPNLWSCYVRGHVQAYEESVDACIREIEEEIGIKVLPENINYLYTFKDDNNTGDKKYINNIFFDNYMLVMDVNINDLELEDDEISEVKYMKYNDVREMIEERDKELIPNFYDYNKLIQILDSKI
jgi:isopentenyl-diphosphate delta-isomerase type 1